MQYQPKLKQCVMTGPFNEQDSVRQVANTPWASVSPCFKIKAKLSGVNADRQSFHLLYRIPFKTNIIPAFVHNLKSLVMMP